MVAGAASTRLEDNSGQIRQRALAGQLAPFPARKRKIADGLQEALKPMFILSSQLCNPSGKAFGIGPRVRAAQPRPGVVGDEHDALGVVPRFLENVQENPDHEVHRRRIVIDEYQPAYRRFDGLFVTGAAPTICCMLVQHRIPNCCPRALCRRTIVGLHHGSTRGSRLGAIMVAVAMSLVGQGPPWPAG